MENDVSTSLSWGVLASLVVSTAKKFGMPESFAPAANLVLAGIGSFLFSLSQGVSPKQALLTAVMAFFSGHLFHQSASKHIGG